MTYELNSISTEFYSSQEKNFFDLFVNAWDETINELRYKHIQFELGNRMRPRLVYWGFVANSQDVVDNKINIAVEIAVIIELIHKTSIILDDYIDSDNARRGEQCFHIKYGAERTMMFSLNIIGKALNKINFLARQMKITDKEYHNYVSIFTDTMINMSDGILNELDMNKTNRYEIENIRKICEQETAYLLTNSILLGYCSGGGCNITVLDKFETIGKKCGYLFQLMNDMEAWCQTKKNINYKGKLNLDIEKNRKSIIMCVLYDSLTTKEKRIINTTFGEEKSQICLNLFKKYNIQSELIKESEIIIDDILKRIMSLNRTLTSKWCESFCAFIHRVYELCLNRLNNSGR